LAAGDGPSGRDGLLLLERVLLDQMGSPVTLLRALGDLGQSWLSWR
jgi:hypothetical protein